MKMSGTNIWVKHSQRLVPIKKMSEPGSAFQPGDEWGDQKEVSRLISQSFPSITINAPKFVEIGSGGGRYTVPLMNKFPECTVDAFDVSSGYIAKLKQRIGDLGFSDRINIHKLDNEPDTISKIIGELGLVRKIDVVYSYDAMVHVDLQSLLIYFVNAANILKPMGCLVMNVADATSEKGMQRLFSSAARVFRQGGAPSTKFIWHSPSVFQKFSLVWVLRSSLNTQMVGIYI